MFITGWQEGAENSGLIGSQEKYLQTLAGVQQPQRINQRCVRKDCGKEYFPGRLPGKACKAGEMNESSEDHGHSGRNRRVSGYSSTRRTKSGIDETKAQNRFCPRIISPKAMSRRLDG